MLSENNHEGIGDAKRDTAQNANEEAIHGKACTTARISVQAPAVRTERGGSEMSHARLLDRLRRFVDLVNSGDRSQQALPRRALLQRCNRGLCGGRPLAVCLHNGYRDCASGAYGISLTL